MCALPFALNGLFWFYLVLLLRYNYCVTYNYCVAI